MSEVLPNVLSKSYRFSLCSSSRVWTPEGLRSLSGQPPVALAPGTRTEHVSFLSAMDHVHQLIFRASIQSIQAFHSSMFKGPLPEASQPPYSDTNNGSPFRSA